MNYVIKDIFLPKPNTDIFSAYNQAEDIEEQLTQYANDKLGKNCPFVAIQPRKRFKFDCPCNCGNTYVWLEQIAFTPDKQKQILYVQCANSYCGENFLIYQENVPE